MTDDPTPTTTDRGKAHYTDVAMLFATIVALGAVAPWIYDLVELGVGVADPFTGTLLRLFAPLMVVFLIISMGVSARTRP